MRAGVGEVGKKRGVGRGVGEGVQLLMEQHLYNNCLFEDSPYEAVRAWIFQHGLECLRFITSVFSAGRPHLAVFDSQKQPDTRTSALRPHCIYGRKATPGRELSQPERPAPRSPRLGRLDFAT